MGYDIILFDLDGTLTDSGEGITKCAALALEHFGIMVKDLNELRSFVGPPLRESFAKKGIPENSIEEAIRIFRGRYLVTGKFENRPYDGIHALLQKLRAAGKTLYVATSKPEQTAYEVLDKFELAGYFDGIFGASFDAGRETKAEVLRYLIESTGITPERDPVVMVGDTAFDVTGAKQFGIPTIGVSWGYGITEEMVEAGACTIVDTVDELLEVLL